MNELLMDSPFPSAQEAHSAFNHVNEVYERILPLLAKALNSIHGKDYSVRYWRIVIGPWLIFYLPVVYDRYMHLKTALEKHPDLTTTVLSESCFMTPLNTLDFVARLSDDLFNLQIYSKIFLSLEKKFPNKESQF
jgi:putative transferase (TIGR04331 family)